MTVRKLYDNKLLFAKISEGDEESFRLFFDLYKKRLFRFIKNITKSGDIAEELVHDVFLKIWQEQKKLQEVDHPETFVWVIAKNKALSHLRKVARDTRLIDEVAINMSAVHNDTNELIEANESHRLIEASIQTLSPQQQQVYWLSRRDGLSHEQIAAKLNISKNTVNNHLTAALKQIRAYLISYNRELLLLLVGLSFKK